MIPKWKTPGTITPIGNKIILYLAVAAVVCNLYACNLFSWDCRTAGHDVLVKNATNDTLMIRFRENEIAKFYPIHPNSTFDYATLNGLCDDEDFDPIETLFENAELICQVKIKDSLTIQWTHEGFNEDSSNEHHFFNYYSWQKGNTDSAYIFDYILFEIKESDFGHIDE